MSSQQHKTPLTLCIIHQPPRILLGMKKRGFGKGRWNGFGGHVEKGETVEDAARREIQEEAGLMAGQLEKRGIIEFKWQEKPEILEVHVFHTADFAGEPIESDEMRPQWFDVNKIPYSEMWSDDIHWLPLFLQGKKFTAKFLFGSADRVLTHEIKEVSKL